MNLNKKAAIVTGAGRRIGFGISKTCAKENGSKNIRCNVIVSEFIESEMTTNIPNKA